MTPTEPTPNCENSQNEEACGDCEACLRVGMDAALRGRAEAVAALTAAVDRAEEYRREGGSACERLAQAPHSAKDWQEFAVKQKERAEWAERDAEADNAEAIRARAERDDARAECERYRALLSRTKAGCLAQRPGHG
jgi:hypothetical protein